MVDAATPPAVRFSIRLEVLPGETVAAQLAAAHRFGFDAVGLPGRFLETWLPALRACRAESPVALDALSLGFEGSLLSAAADSRRRCADSLLRLLDLCAELGVKKFNLPPALRMDTPDRVDAPGGFPSVEARLDAMLLEQLPALAEAAGERGVTLLLEPVNRYETDYLTSVEHAARLCARLDHPAVGLTADFFHMQIEELSMPAALAAAGAWIGHVHVAENTRVEPGPGSLDFVPGFCALRRLGYRGTVEIECRRLSGPAEETLPRSLAYLKRLWDEATPEEG